jgi:hypothetical protein
MVISGHRHAGKIVDLPERRRTNERAITSCAEYRDPSPDISPLEMAVAEPKGGEFVNLSRPAKAMPNVSNRFAA